VDVDGNVTIFPGGSLIARDVVIRGNLDASRAYVVDLESSEVQGDVNLEELVGDASSIEQTIVGGDVLLKGNRSALDILNNDVSGTMQAVANTGGVTISGNSFEAGLNCSDNTPPPDGIGNEVGDLEEEEEEQDQEDEEEDDQDDDQDDEEEDDDEDDEDNDNEDNDKKGKDKKGKKDREQNAGQCEDLPAEPTVTPPAPTPPATPTAAATIVPPATPTAAATIVPPATSTPPAPSDPAITTVTPPPDPTPTTASDTDDFADEGGVGAFGWQVALLLPLLAWRRYRRRRSNEVALRQSRGSKC
jgi:hypothetical protein